MQDLIKQAKRGLRNAWDKLGAYVDETTEANKMIADETRLEPLVELVSDNKVLEPQITPQQVKAQLTAHLGETVLKFDAVCKSFGEFEKRVDVLEGINLEVREKELLAILGFSGSGKTTLINLIAGLQKPTAGTVTLCGDVIEGPGPDRGLIFQTYSLMPWLTVKQNVLLAVDEVFPHDNAQQKTARAEKYIAMVGLDHAMDRRPAELSGGMRQRVNVARALSMEPEILLLDEPLSALDALTRAKLQDDIARIVREEQKTAILITNDVDEALIMADRIVPLTTAPKAHMGIEFLVQLPLPACGFRDRLALTDNKMFKAQRREITEYLLALGEAKDSAAAEEGEAPNITPIHDQMPPKAYRDEAHAMMPKRYLEFYNVKKIYPTPKGPLTVVDGFDFIMEKGDFVSIIGHSGCGKVLDVNLPRPRSRKALLAHPDYEYYRGQVLEFLDEYEHGATSKKDAKPPADKAPDVAQESEAKDAA